MFVAPRFQRATEFTSELKRRVNLYFESHQQAPTGNWHLFSKALILLTGLAFVYVHLVFFTPAWGWALLECLVLGLFTASIGFNVMHDGGHGSFSDKPWLNELAGMSLNLLGANITMWKTKHNAVHHTFTNIDGVDDDIEARPYLRMSPDQTRHKIHRLQHYYFWFLYALLYIQWISYTDYRKYFTGKVGNVPIKPLTLWEHISFWSFKVLHLLAFVVLPIVFVGFVPWLVGFLVYGSFTGILLSVVFQLAHVVEETSFLQAPPAPDSLNLEDEFMVHQLRTTANFATRSKLLGWWLGGLNFQVEHHLFPNISHVHYPAISGIVKQVCSEFKMPYHEHRYFVGALWSHMKHLRSLGMA